MKCANCIAVEFDEVIAMIDANFDINPTAFAVGDVAPRSLEILSMLPKEFSTPGLP